MPLTKKGKKIKASLVKQHGKTKGESIFFAMENKRKSLATRKA